MARDGEETSRYWQQTVRANQGNGGQDNAGNGRQLVDAPVNVPYRAANVQRACRWWASGCSDVAPPRTVQIHHGRRWKQWAALPRASVPALALPAFQLWLHAAYNALPVVHVPRLDSTLDQQRKAM